MFRARSLIDLISRPAVLSSHVPLSLRIYPFLIPHRQTARQQANLTQKVKAHIHIYIHRTDPTKDPNTFLF